ncbi:flippase [Patescibacteria group bacterium]|nr:flippase [Patescibacteria group bacterium]
MGRAGVAMLSLAVIKIITGYLSVSSYGQYTNVYEFLALFAIIADFGLYTIAVREMSRNEEEIPEILGNILTIRLLIGFIVLFCVSIAGFFIPSHQETQIPYAILIVTTASLIALINGTMASVLQTKYKMQYAAVAQVFGKIIQVAYMTIAVYVLFANDPYIGFYHLFVAGVIGNFAMLFMTVWAVRKYTVISFRFDKERIKYILKQAAPYGIALFLSNIYFRADAILVFNMRGSQEAGYYGVAARMLEALVILPLFFMNAVLPTLTKHIKEKRDSYKQILQYTFDFQLILSLPFVVGGFILAKPLIYLISKPEFIGDSAAGIYGSDTALQIILFSLILVSVNVVFNYTLIAIKKQANLIWINGICATFNVIANLIVIPQYGFRGAAFATIASELLVLVLVMSTAKKYLPFTISPVRGLKVLLSSLIMGAVVYILRDPMASVIGNWNILVLVPIGGIIYIGSLLATRAVTKDLIQMVRK